MCPCRVPLGLSDMPHSSDDDLERPGRPADCQSDVPRTVREGGQSWTRPTADRALGPRKTFDPIYGAAQDDGPSRTEPPGGGAPDARPRARAQINLPTSLNETHKRHGIPVQSRRESGGCTADARPSIDGVCRTECSLIILVYIYMLGKKNITSRFRPAFLPRAFAQILARGARRRGPPKRPIVGDRKSPWPTG